MFWVHTFTILVLSSAGVIDRAGAISMANGTRMSQYLVRHHFYGKVGRSVGQGQLYICSSKAVIRHNIWGMSNVCLICHCLWDMHSRNTEYFDIHL